MAFSKEYRAFDGTHRIDFFDDDGNLMTTHVLRYDWSGNYSHTDVYDGDYLIDSFVDYRRK